MGKLRLYAARLRSSLWFLPMLMVGGAIGLAMGLIEADARMHNELATRWPRLFNASPEGTEAMLSAIAGSMITVAGVVFSITIVAIGQASTQYSPRVLRNFVRDRANQCVLGFFVGAFAYCLVVLRNLTYDKGQHTVPALAAFVAFLLALFAVGFLIFYIHHIASSIQASTMISAISAETLAVIEHMYPRKSAPAVIQEEQRQQREKDSEHQYDAERWYPVPALTSGYIQQIDHERLLRIACAQDAVVRMELGIGEFALAGRPLVSLCGCGEPTDTIIRNINWNYAIDAHRTVDQDPGFGIQQLADIAVKALSPGINDTTTATTVVDYLSSILFELVDRRFEPSHYFSGGNLRIIARGWDFPTFCAATFDPIIENAGGNQSVLGHLLCALERLAERAVRSRREVLLQHARAVAELTATVENSMTRSRVERHAQRIIALLSEDRVG